MVVIIKSIDPRIKRRTYEERLEHLQEQLVLQEGFIELKTSNKLMSESCVSEWQVNISFDNYANFKKWEHACNGCLNFLEAFEINKPRPLKTSYWIRVAKNILTVYPLILATDWLLSSIFRMDALRPQVTIFFNLFIVVLLMQCPIIPFFKTFFCTRLLRGRFFDGGKGEIFDRMV